MRQKTCIRLSWNEGAVQDSMGEYYKAAGTLTKAIELDLWASMAE